MNQPTHFDIDESRAVAVAHHLAAMAAPAAAHAPRDPAIIAHDMTNELDAALAFFRATHPVWAKRCDDKIRRIRLELAEHDVRQPAVDPARGADEAFALMTGGAR